MVDFNNSPTANAMKNSSGLWDPTILYPHGYWKLSFFVSLKNMATTKVNQAIDFQIQIAPVAVLENIHWVDIAR